jgi:hypothetical protein
MQTARNDPIRGCADRRGPDGRQPPGAVTLLVMAGCETRASRNDPIRGYSGRLGRDGWRPPGAVSLLDMVVCKGGCRATTLYVAMRIGTARMVGGRLARCRC